jgi:HMG (high mobility group) box
MLFCKENREKVKAEDPEITFGGIGKKLGSMWRAMSVEEQKTYKDRKG